MVKEWKLVDSWAGHIMREKDDMKVIVFNKI